MGCHTWFYKVAEKQYTIDEFKKLIVDMLNDNIDLANQLSNGKLDKDIAEAYPEWDADLGDASKKKYESMQNDIKTNDYTLKQLYDQYFDMMYEEILLHNGLFYEETEYHDLFRVTGYPQSRLTTKDETFNFINDLTNNCTIYDKTTKLLEEFWMKYPDGLIEFG